MLSARIPPPSVPAAGHRRRRPRAFGLAAALAIAGCTIAGCTLVAPPVRSPPPSLPGPPEPEPSEPPASESAILRKGGQLMSGTDVRSILTRARYRWEGAAGAAGTATTTPDGRIRVIWDTGAANGRIRFTDSGYCSRFDGVRGGAEDCYRLYRTGPGEYEVFRLDGTRSGRIRIIG